ELAPFKVVRIAPGRRLAPSIEIARHRRRTLTASEGTRTWEGPGTLPGPRRCMIGRQVRRSRRGSTGRAEMHGCRAAADPLNPHVLDTFNVWGDVVLGDDHLRGEGLFVAVAGPVEVGFENGGARVGGRDLCGLARLTGAFEPRFGQERGGVPTHALAGETSGQGSLRDAFRAPEAAA